MQLQTAHLAVTIVEPRTSCCEILAFHTSGPMLGEQIELRDSAPLQKDTRHRWKLTNSTEPLGVRCCKECQLCDFQRYANAAAVCPRRRNDCDMKKQLPLSVDSPLGCDLYHLQL